jgi:uncharacterized protein (TIGR04255 family)
MPNQINLNEKFTHLSKAPIVEAIFDIRVASVFWDEVVLREQLKQMLPDFPKVDNLQQIQFQFMPGQSEKSSFKDISTTGLRLNSSDGLHVVQFNKTAFTFSRLKPYANWESFRHEALRLWKIYYELLKPAEILRIGLRFINRISIKQNIIELSDYYKYPPEPLKDLKWPLTGYLHHDMMQVPETEYIVNLIKTVQYAPAETGLLLDIDVFLQNQSGYDKRLIIDSLEEMHWIKNKIFFSSITEKLEKELK